MLLPDGIRINRYWLEGPALFISRTGISAFMQAGKRYPAGTAVTTLTDTGSGSGLDKKSDTSATGKSGDTAAGVPGTGTEKEPVIQTGRTSPIYFLAAIGMAGILLAALSVREGKRSSKE